MGQTISTVIIDPRSLMREALASLMESNSYCVVCSVGSAAEIEQGAFRDMQPELVILGALPTASVAEAVSSIRRCWQGAKIIMLFEKASSTDFQRLLASRLDACLPMTVSQRTLIAALQLVVGEQLRVLMVSDSTILGTSEVDVRLEGPPPIASISHSVMPLAESSLAPGGRRVRGLSEREEQVLRALVRGHSNKMIAREYTVTEATVKVHLKAILRKIGVANRTQAAIWALKNAYSANVGEGRMGMEGALSVSA
jgi:two-component system nitrate/nitrite response regulator NarL